MPEWLITLFFTEAIGFWRNIVAICDSTFVHFPCMYTIFRCIEWETTNCRTIFFLYEKSEQQVKPTIFQIARNRRRINLCQNTNHCIDKEKKSLRLNTFNVDCALADRRNATTAAAAACESVQHFWNELNYGMEYAYLFPLFWHSFFCFEPIRFMCCSNFVL